MSTAITSADVYTDFQGLARLKTAAKLESPNALRSVAEQFESIFLNMMLKSMRDANLGEGMFDNDQSKFYNEMFDQQIAVTLAKRRSVGLADVLINQLSPDAGLKNSGVGLPPSGQPLPLLLKPFAVTAPQTFTPPAQDSSPRSSSPNDFVSRVLPAAEQAAQRLGVAPIALIAQSALETGWGQAVPRYADGSTSHNMFGIKAEDSWKGKTIGITTIEYVNGIAQRRQERFRAYDSFEESFSDYANFLSANPRYSQALQVGGDSGRFVEELQAAGYATDPQYANKLKGIMQGGVLNGALAASRFLEASR